MAKNNSISSQQRCVLIISRNELSGHLKTQIERGRLVAQMPVASSATTDYYGRANQVIYDKKQEDEFKDAKNKWLSFVEELLKQSFSISNNDYYNDFCETGQSLIYFPGQDYIQIERDEINEKITCLESLLERLPLIPSSIESFIAPAEQSHTSKSKRVFIVHGHDSTNRAEVELFVKKLGYEPIVLFKQASGGKTIIEKLEEETEGICYAVILYTVCDYGRDKTESKEQPRARQNVVFEHGYLSAKLGRDHVCALVEPGIEIPSDLAGVVYVSLSEQWEYRIAKEMKQAGLEIDMNLL